MSAMDENQGAGAKGHGTGKRSQASSAYIRSIEGDMPQIFKQRRAELVKL